jgi:hypothetical protein
MTCSVCETCSEHCTNGDPIVCAASVLSYSLRGYGPKDERTAAAKRQLGQAIERVEAADAGSLCWGLRGAEAVLKLRSLRASGDLDAYWTFHEHAEHVRNHLDLYAAAPPPTVLPLKLVGRAHLSLVK